MAEEEQVSLEGQVEDLKRMLEQKRAQVRQQDQVIAQLVDDNAMRESEIERLSNILNEKDEELQQLESRLTNNGASGNGTSPGVYNPFKGDTVDEYLARYLNMMQC